MSYKVKLIPKFEHQLKKLSKKYPSLKAEYVQLVQSLKSNPEQGIALGNNCFKIRISIASKAKGKSGGGRVITCIRVTESTVYLLTIFDKSERETMPDKELRELLKYLPET